MINIYYLSYKKGDKDDICMTFTIDNFKLPITITIDLIDELIKKNIDLDKPPRNICICNLVMSYPFSTHILIPTFGSVGSVASRFLIPGAVPRPLTPKSYVILFTIPHTKYITFTIILIVGRACCKPFIQRVSMGPLA